MPPNELEMAVERFNSSLSALQQATERVKATDPLDSKERAATLIRIDEAIAAIRSVVGEEAIDGSGHR